MCLLYIHPSNWLPFWTGKVWGQSHAACNKQRPSVLQDLAQCQLPGGYPYNGFPSLVFLASLSRRPKWVCILQRNRTNRVSIYLKIFAIRNWLTYIIRLRSPRLYLISQRLRTADDVNPIQVQRQEAPSSKIGGRKRRRKGRMERGRGRSVRGRKGGREGGGGEEGGGEGERMLLCFFSYRPSVAG